MTRILITSLNYAPEETGIAPYSTAVAEHLAIQGYQVTVVAGMPHYPQWRVAGRYRNRRSLIEHRNLVEVRRRAHYVPPIQSALNRARYEASSLALALEARRVERPSAVLGIVPSISGGVAARTAAASFRVPYGIVFQDLVGAAAEQSGIAGSKIAALTRTAESWIARDAAAVGIVAEGFRPYVEALGVQSDRIRRLRNWTRTPAPTIPRDDIRRDLGWPGDAFVCLHAGNMGTKQGLENVVQAARLAIASNAPLLFVLMGDGNQRRALQVLAGRYNLPNLRFLPLQPDDRFSSILAAADVLLVNQRASVADMSLPSKLTAYFAAGRPVVAACAPHSETARGITDSGAGLVVAPESPRALIDGIMRIVADSGLAAHLVARAHYWGQEVLSPGVALRGYEQFVATLLTAAGTGRVHTPYRAPLPVITHAAPPETTADDRRAA
jgi:glycosyltransferase involved in cell wall biosynthesis